MRTGLSGRGIGSRTAGYPGTPDRPRDGAPDQPGARTSDRPGAPTAVRIGAGPELIAATLGEAGGLQVELLANGAVRAIRHGAILVNQVLGSPVEPGIGNLYLRRHLHGRPKRRASAGIEWSALVGPGADSFLVGPASAEWRSERHGLSTSCTVRVASDLNVVLWSLRITNTGADAALVDAVLAQDMGLAEEASVRASELYTSQYIDHTVLHDPDLGFLLCSRQNLAQAGAHPWIVHGCTVGARGYLTDGFQFYGLDYRATNRPVALDLTRLPNRVYQYELSLATLQSQLIRLPPGATREIAFFGRFVADHPAASGPDDIGLARGAAVAFTRAGPSADTVEVERSRSIFDAPAMFASADLTAEELDEWYGKDRRHVELRDGRTRSFFFGRKRHAVLRSKELVTERPAGHIVQSGTGPGHALLPDDDRLSATAWMDGVFASQLAIGNTSFNALVGVWRNPLNVLRSSGLRVFAGEELLGLPSSFDMGPNDARWIYSGGDRTIVVRVATSGDDPIMSLDVDVERGGPLKLVIVLELALGEGAESPSEWATARIHGGRIALRPAPSTLIGQRYPEATFHVVVPDPATIRSIGGDELLDDLAAARTSGDAGTVPDRRPSSHIVIATHPVDRFALDITGSVVSSGRATELAERSVRSRRWPASEPGPDRPAGSRPGWSTGPLPRAPADPRPGSRPRAQAGHPADPPAAVATDPWTRSGRHLEIASGPGSDEVGRLDEILPWFAQNAQVHLLTPHGLEQSAGAAWGVRDVCQGPAEFFVAMREFAALRGILRIVYEHQYEDSGDWPQWFMFDRYHEIQASESHGDVILWPLKALCDYVEATGDASILDETVRFTDPATKAFSARAATVFEHTLRQVDGIERTFIPGTALVAFGHGDWEDTLQPADPAMAERLVSPWTVELAWQTLGRYRLVCERAGRDEMAARLAVLCDRIRADFNRYLVPDGIVAGLAHLGQGAVEYLLHPRDTRTGVSYRLLPMTRGMISGLFTPDQVRRHLSLVARHLSFPDGVRLMNRPVDYRGGVERTFRRAESAANFGREVGLQYVHAHLRFVEAMARVGRPDDAFRALLAVCPVGLEATVPSALPRQANAYFSSSDAAFADRYAASRRFGAVRSQRVGVKGGWRVYSSGPGLFIHQLVCNLLGLREAFEDVVFDPVLPRRLDGVEFRADYAGRPITYRYRVVGNGFAPSEVTVNGRRMEARRTANPYRAGGLLVRREAFLEALDRDENGVEIRT